TPFDPPHQFRAEVKPRGRCGHRAALPRVNRLIPCAILGGQVPIDVGWKWHLAISSDGFERLVRTCFQTDDPLAAIGLFENPDTEVRPSLDDFPGLQLRAGPDERRPGMIRFRHRVKEQHLGGTTSRPPAPQPRREDTRLVDHQNVIRLDQVHEVRKTAVSDRTGYTIEHEETALLPYGRRVTRDALWG